jgi:hypothetical protein
MQRGLLVALLALVGFGIVAFAQDAGTTARPLKAIANHRVIKPADARWVFAFDRVIQVLPVFGILLYTIPSINERHYPYCSFVINGLAFGYPVAQTYYGELSGRITLG